MDRDSGYYSRCILCCHTFPNSCANPPLNEDSVKTLTQFIQQTGVVNRKCLSSNGFLGLGQVSICPECLSGVTKAVEKRSLVEEAELDISRMKWRRERLMEGHLEELTKLGRRIRQRDEGCLRLIAGMAEGGGEEGAWKWDNVFQFREGIVRVTKEMNQCGDNLSKKDLGNGDDGKDKVFDLKKWVSSYLSRNGQVVNSGRDGPDVPPEAEPEVDQKGAEMEADVSSDEEEDESSPLETPSVPVPSTSRTSFVSNERNQNAGSSKVAKRKLPNRKSKPNSISNSANRTSVTSRRMKNCDILNKVSAEGRKSFECLICRKSYRQRKYALIHYNRSHESLNRPCYKCYLCPEQFTNFYDIQDHMTNNHR